MEGFRDGRVIYLSAKPEEHSGKEARRRLHPSRSSGGQRGLSAPREEILERLSRQHRLLRHPLNEVGLSCCSLWGCRGNTTALFLKLKSSLLKGFRDFIKRVKCLTLDFLFGVKEINTYSPFDRLSYTIWGLRTQWKRTRNWGKGRHCVMSRAASHGAIPDFPCAAWVNLWFISDNEMLARLFPFGRSTLERGDVAVVGHPLDKDILSFHVHTGWDMGQTQAKSIKQSQILRWHVFLHAKG